MSRLAKTIKNARVSVFFHLIFIVVQFFSRKIFLDKLGDEFIGITSTLLSFIGFLNLAELGIGTAIGFTLYKPIFDKNHEEINGIISFFGNLYRKIGAITIGLAIVLSVFFPFIFGGSAIDLGIIYYAFFAFLFGSLLGYFFNYHLFLLQADQKNYEVIKYFQANTIVKIILQSVLLIYTQSYILWITLELVSAVVFSITLRRKIKKEYPWLIISPKDYKGKKDFGTYSVLVKKIKQISLHKVGTFISNGTDNILIFAYISAQTVAFFGNYQLIIMSLNTLLGKLFSGTNASVGDLVAERDDSKIKQVFWELMALRFFISGIAIMGIVNLVDPFIILWLGEKYILESTILYLFAFNFFMLQIRQPTDVFKQAYGLYDDTWAPVAQSIMNLGVSILLVTKLGLAGILLGTSTSLVVIVMLWRPYFVYKRGFVRPFREYVNGLLKLALTFVIFYVCIQFLINYLDWHATNFFHWLLMACFTVIASAVFYGGILYLSSSYFRDLIGRIKHTIKSRYKKSDPN